MENPQKYHFQVNGGIVAVGLGGNAAHTVLFCRSTATSDEVKAFLDRHSTAAATTVFLATAAQRLRLHLDHTAAPANTVICFPAIAQQCIATAAAVPSNIQWVPMAFGQQCKVPLSSLRHALVSPFPLGLGAGMAGWRMTTDTGKSFSLLDAFAVEPGPLSHPLRAGALLSADVMLLGLQGLRQLTPASLASSPALEGVRRRLGERLLPLCAFLPASIEPLLAFSPCFGAVQTTLAWKAGSCGSRSSWKVKVLKRHTRFGNI